MPIKLLLYDDNEVLRESLSVLVSGFEEFELMATMPNAETVLEDIEQFTPDVLLMDIDMPVVSGIDALGVIRRKHSNLPVIMLTVFDDDDNIYRAICAGASGYILKRNVTEEVQGAIKMVLNGGAPMTGSVAKTVLQIMPREQIAAVDRPSLAKREVQILKLLVNGYSYKMIASELQMSIDTVRFHIKKVYDKLQVHSATEAVSKAIKNKLVD